MCLTLSHYFLNETNLYLKLVDQKKKEEIFNNIKNNSRKKYSQLNVKNEIEKLIF